MLGAVRGEFGGSLYCWNAVLSNAEPNLDRKTKKCVTHRERG